MLKEQMWKTGELDIKAYQHTSICERSVHLHSTSDELGVNLTKPLTYYVSGNYLRSEQKEQNK